VGQRASPPGWYQVRAVGLGEPSAPCQQCKWGDEYDHCSHSVELSVEQAAAMPLSLLVRLNTLCIRPAASQALTAAAEDYPDQWP
jgi:hypothetical protein